MFYTSVLRQWKYTDIGAMYIDIGAMCCIIMVK